MNLIDTFFFKIMKLFYSVHLQVLDMTTLSKLLKGSV